MYKHLFILFCLVFSGHVYSKDIDLPIGDLTTTAHLMTTDDNWQQGPVVLMLHGTIAHNKMEIMTALQEAFLDNDVSSLSVNLSLGLSNRTGMYDCSTPHNHKHSDAISEIALWMDWLKQQGAESIILLGHSRGGNQIAWFASENDDEAIKAVVLAAPSIVTTGDLAKNYEKNYNKPLEPLLVKAQSMLASGMGNKMMEKIDFIYCPETSATAASFVDYYQENDNFYTPKLVDKINKPVYIFAGSEDKVTANVVSEMKKLNNSNIEIFTIDGAGHFFRDLYGEEIVETIVEKIN